MPFIDRTRFLPELQANPALVQRLADMVRGEVGLGRDPTLERIQLETAFNRAEARGIPLEQALKSVSDSPAKGYYASDTYSRPATPQQLQYFKGQVLDPVLNGSNEGFNKFGFTPTGNASQMGFAGRRAANGVYSNYSWYSGKPGVGEMYVTERPDAKWASLQNTNTQLAQNAQQPSIWDNPQAFKPEPHQMPQQAAAPAPTQAPTPAPAQFADAKPASLWDSVPDIIKSGGVSSASAAVPPMPFSGTPQSLFDSLKNPPVIPDIKPNAPQFQPTLGQSQAVNSGIDYPPTTPGQMAMPANAPPPPVTQPMVGAPNNYAPSSLLNTSAPPSSPFDQVTQGASGLQPWQVAGPSVYNNPLGSNPLMLPQINVSPAAPSPPISQPPQASQPPVSGNTLPQIAPMMPPVRPSSDIFAQQVYGTNPTGATYTTPQDFNLQEQAMKTGFAPWAPQFGGSPQPATISPTNPLAASIGSNPLQGGLLQKLLSALSQPGSDIGSTMGNPLSSLLGGMTLPDFSVPMMSMGDVGAISPASFDFGFVG